MAALLDRKPRLQTPGALLCPGLSLPAPCTSLTGPLNSGRILLPRNQCQPMCSSYHEPDLHTGVTHLWARGMPPAASHRWCGCRDHTPCPRSSKTSGVGTDDSFQPGWSNSSERTSQRTPLGNFERFSTCPPESLRFGKGLEEFPHHHHQKKKKRERCGINVKNEGAT